MKAINRSLLLIPTILLAVCFYSEAMGCPTCKDSIAENGANMARGYGMSIMFMMSMPFLLFTSMSLYFYFLVRKANRQAAKLEVANNDS